MKKLLTLFLFFFFLHHFINAQEIPDFAAKGVAYFKFNINGRSELTSLTKIISIDNVKGNAVYAYANAEEFEKFRSLGYTWTNLTLPGEMVPPDELNMGNHTTDNMGRTIWNFYPTYDQYLEFMTGFASSYPSICKLDTIGYSIQGRILLSVKISDSVEYDQAEPEVLLTSSIHGDELTGYVCMLHLIDSLLSSYGNSERITNMINSNQIFINPLANPDGTYKGGNSSVFGAWRGNSNSVDLNRNFPDPKLGPHPDGKQWQAETKRFMRYDTIHKFVLSINFHGGAEVYNYPWDTWAKLHADDSWFIFTGREYADTVHKYSPSYYFRDLNNGVTNGFAWYEINGGRQDYTTYFHYGREVTLEISSTKLPPASQLLNFWKYNKRSFLNYIDQALYGINGQVTDTVSNEPLIAKVQIFGHDFDNSFVYSDSLNGWYYRPIDQGTWALTFSCQGYFTKTVISEVERWNTVRSNVQMVPLTYGVGEKVSKHNVSVFPNPSGGSFNLIMPVDRSGDIVVILFSTDGKKVFEETINQVQGNPVLKIITYLPSGSYLLEAELDDVKYLSKVLINK